MAGGLTPAQAKLLAFLTAYADEHDFSPSVEEMRAGCGLASASGVIRLLDGLEERGAIRRMSHRARSVVVVRRAERAPYSTDALCALPTATLEGIQAVVATELACRLRDAVLASPAGSCPAMEGRR